MNYDPIPSIPIWQKLDDIQRMDEFELVSLDKYLRAVVNEESEELSYIVEVDDRENIIVITDENGQSIGRKEMKHGY